MDCADSSVSISSSKVTPAAVFLTKEEPLHAAENVKAVVIAGLEIVECMALLSVLSAIVPRR